MTLSKPFVVPTDGPAMLPQRQYGASLATTAEAQKFLKLSRTTLWRLERIGQLRGVRIGRALRFPWSELHRLAGAVAPAKDHA